MEVAKTNAPGVPGALSCLLGTAVYDALREKWLAALADPILGPQQALLLLETASPWGWRESLQPRVVAHATDGAAVDLIAPDASASTNRKLLIGGDQVAIIEQLDYWYQESSEGALTAAINGGLIKLLVDGEQDRRLPEFTLDYFARGSNSLRFGKLPLRWVLPRQATVKLVLTPEGTAGGEFDLYVDLLVRREPRWLMEAAGLVDAGSP